MIYHETDIKSLAIVIILAVLASASLANAQTLQTLCSFAGTNGANPQGALTLGTDGNLYGTAIRGGITNALFPYGMGTAFQIMPNGSLKSLVSFNVTNGAEPGSLTLGNDGNFYGTTASGGVTNATYPYGMGTVFQLTTNGGLNVLAYFNGTNGTDPESLTLGNDGTFYGTTDGGGFTNSTYPYGMGTMFQFTTNGELNTLGYFIDTNGVYPTGPLIQGSGGNLYGTTRQGGEGINYSTYYFGNGTAFKITTNGVFATLFYFANTNGVYPNSGLTLGNDSEFYGTTCYGGITGLEAGNGFGTIFKITTNGLLTTLYSFTGGNDGGNPSANLILGNDGNFYGTTSYNGAGSIFRVTTNGQLTTLFSFFTNGMPNVAFLPNTLTLGNDGTLYSTTQDGGMTNPMFPNGFGTIFRLLMPPVVAIQPMSQTNNAGATVSFSVSATSLNSIAYQWQKNGTNLSDGDNISGTTNNVLIITSISDRDAASYSAIVSNANFGVTSSNAMLTVIDPPVIMEQPTNRLVLPGTTVTFGVLLAGSVSLFRYQWQLGGTNLPNANNATYSIPSVNTNNAGNYSVVVTNAAGSVVSSNAALTVVLSPQSQADYAGSTATFNGNAFSPESLSLSYQWRRNGTNIGDGGNLLGADTSTLTIASISDADAAFYNLVVSDATGSVTTSNAVLTVNDFPFIAAQPQSQTVVPGANVTFAATAYGAAPLIFQWYFDDIPIGFPTSGTNAANYTLTNVGTNDAGIYTVEAVNAYGDVTSSNAMLIVSLPPVITAQPVSLTNAANSTATFAVTASSVAGLSYQWQQNGTNLLNGGKFSGVLTNILTITGVSSNEAAVYSVELTNLAGNVTSSNATLTVIYPPVITAQPIGQSVILGSGVLWNVTVGGTPPFNYQWRLNAVNLWNATNSTYEILTVGTNSTGNYSVVVTNLAGSVTSSNGLLVVLVPPSLVLQLWAGYPVLSLNGTLSNKFVVQYSQGLPGTNWITLLSLSNLLTSPYLFLDPAGIVSPARFYRAVMQ